jgi:hypothetical protein
LGDYYQTAADLDANIQTAQVTADRLRDWMISQQIIVPTASDRVLGGLGYAPDKNYTLAVKQPYPILFELHVNGVEFIAKRSVFYAMGIGRISVVCSACRGAFELNDPWSEAVNEWYEDTGPALLPCAHCGAEAPITDWQHDPPFAFGNVGVTFWNWPELRDDFVKTLTDLTGHRFRLIYGKV